VFQTFTKQISTRTAPLFGVRKFHDTYNLFLVVYFTKLLISQMSNGG
jgi:hypothetical protein